jgi:hypothetical protein
VPRQAGVTRSEAENEKRQVNHLPFFYSIALKTVIPAEAGIHTPSPNSDTQHGSGVRRDDGMLRLAIVVAALTPAAA